MRTKDMAPLIKAVATVVREYVGLAIGDVVARVKALEERVANALVMSPAEAELRGLIADLRERQTVIEAKAGPGDRGADGAQGPPGVPGADGGVGPQGAQGPIGERGSEGAVGPPGAPGGQGPPGLTGPAGPTGERGSTGEKGLDGLIGERGPEGPIGAVGRDGRDGLSVSGTPGEKGLDGMPGRDGVDGLGFDDVAVLHDGERGFTVRFVRGEKVKEFAFMIPALIYRGVYVEQKTYTVGDVSTWAGATWHCNELTTSKPGEGSKAWTLMVKRGRDGKDGRDADPGLPVVSVGKR